MSKLKLVFVLSFSVLWVCVIFALGFLLCLALTFEELKAGWGLLDRLEGMEAGDFRGFYSSEYGYMLCDFETSCFHEVAHWKDDRLDWISQTPEFREAVDSFTASCADENRDNSYYCRTVFLDFPGLKGNKEIYARMYMNYLYHQRPIPDIFLEFYPNLP